MTVDYFYRKQAQWFGAEVTFQIVATKVIVDQFIYLGRGSPVSSESLSRSLRFDSSMES